MSASKSWEQGQHDNWRGLLGVGYVTFQLPRLELRRHWEICGTINSGCHRQVLSYHGFGAEMLESNRHISAEMAIEAGEEEACMPFCWYSLPPAVAWHTPCGP